MGKKGPLIDTASQTRLVFEGNPFLRLLALGNRNQGQDLRKQTCQETHFKRTVLEIFSIYLFSLCFGTLLSEPFFRNPSFGTLSEMGQKPIPASEHHNPHQKRPTWVVHLPQNGTKTALTHSHLEMGVVSSFVGPSLQIHSTAPGAGRHGHAHRAVVVHGLEQRRVASEQAAAQRTPEGSPKKAAP